MLSVGLAANPFSVTTSIISRIASCLPEVLISWIESGVLTPITPRTAQWRLSPRLIIADESSRETTKSTNDEDNIGLKVNSIQTKLAIEQKTQDGAAHLLPNLHDDVLKEQCQHAITESKKRVVYLETEMRKLSVLRKNLVTGDDGNLQCVISKQDTISRSRRRSDPNLKLHIREVGGNLDLNLTRDAFDESKRESQMERNSKINRTKQESEVPAIPTEFSTQEVLSDFDYLKTQTILSPQKVKYKLAEVEAKLAIEQRVKTGTERMFQVMKQQATAASYKDDRQLQVGEKLVECQTKVALLAKSRQKYKGLDLDDGNLLVLAQDESPVNQYKISKRPQSGKLQIKVIAVNGLPPKKSPKSEVYVTFKVDGMVKGQTKFSPTNKFFEDFEIIVEKALEIEICVHERGGVILALLWYKLAELETMLRLRAMNTAFEAQNVGAEQIQGNNGKSNDEKGDLWLDLEPGGQIALNLNFVAAAGKLQRMFTKAFFLISQKPQQYSEIKLSLEMLLFKKDINAKCITLGEKETGDGGEDQLMRHKIPHRFENTYNIGVNWCCHCGYMLSLVRKECKRCVECGISAHASCSLLVPSLCGLTSDLIDQMKRAIDQAEKLKKEKEIMKAEKAKVIEGREQKNSQPSTAAQEIITAEPTAAAKANIIENKQIDKQTERLSQVQGNAQRVGARNNRGVSLDDFNLMAVLGKGNFGKVMLAEEKITKKYYAIKVLKKDFVIENDEAESTRSEKRVFLTANLERFPFLVNLHSCFQTETRLYFVMEFVSGGDLMWHIQHERFSEKRAKYYACEVLLALEYFHKNNITYRDLKLDNILLTLEGHIKIADYGLCKENMPFGATTRTFCGTPEFMAPEILKEKPYTRAVDWWALGVLIYEMILGQSPFPGDGEDQIFDAILHDDVLFPGNMNKDAVDVLKKDPTLRLGAGQKDSEDIKEHPYFRGVSWDDVLNLRIPPPFFPKITSPTDISNFDEEFTKEMPWAQQARAKVRESQPPTPHVQK
ncbi:Serine/threonine kinase [Physocladia obscura]|uniref:protein kinase C n=1 Tax=Physocladia obscura TaxID=109957 RepID=A0AAD5XA88_9FUNG|nr:Serine/threonine kinase [Physocladia obscura]